MNALTREEFFDGVVEKSPPSPEQLVIFAAIAAERKYQDAKWGGSEHDSQHRTWDWLKFIREELREADDAAGRADTKSMKAELVQVAALCVAAIEHVNDYNGIPKRGNDTRIG